MVASQSNALKVKSGNPYITYHDQVRCKVAADRRLLYSRNRNRPGARRECIVGPTGASQGSYSAILEVDFFLVINRNFGILMPRVTPERHEFTSGRSLANYGRSIAAAVVITQLLLGGY